jgi:signal transduction histidine kinase/CheY-like chemotaxis protein
MPTSVDMDRELREDFEAMQRETWAAVLLPLSAGWLSWWLGWLRFDLVRVSVLAAGIGAVTLLDVRLAARVRHPVRLYLLGHVANILLVTALLHYAGGIALTAGPMLYVIVVLNAGIVGTRWSFVLAILGTVSYGVLGALELSGVEPVPAFDPAVRDALARAFPGTIVVLATLLLVCARFALKAVGLVDARRRKLCEEAATRDLQIARARAAERRAIDDRNRVSRDRTKEHVELVRLLVHDLKGPINSIFTAAELSLREDRPRLPPSAVGRLERIRATAGSADDRLLELQGLFHELSTPEPITRVDLADVVQAVVAESDGIVARRGIGVTVGPLPAVPGQQKKLHHVFQNVLSNAFKYTPARSGRIHIHAALDEETATICVDDNGPGVRPEWRSMVFQLFWRAPEEAQWVDGRSIGGTGVGLALVKRLVERHRGTIVCEESPLGGVRMRLRLPRQLSVRRPAQAGGTPVLVVDDNALFLETMRAVLEDSRPDFSVFTAETGEEMQAYLRRSSPYDDVPRPAFIVMDYLLPDGFGTDHLAQASDAHNLEATPVLLLSTKEWTAADAAALETTVTVVATKPSSVDALRDLVLQFYEEHVDHASEEAS